jgi:hypothetical protein
MDEKYILLRLQEYYSDSRKLFPLGDFAPRDGSQTRPDLCENIFENNDKAPALISPRELFFQQIVVKQSFAGI